MNSIIKLPFYARAALFLVGIYLFFNLLFIAQDILLPLIYACIIAILLSPIVSFFVNKKINRTLAITSILLITLMLIIGIVILLLSQANKFNAALPNLEIKLKALLAQSITWVSKTFKISTQSIDAWIVNSKADLLKNSNVTIGKTLSSMGGILATAFLTPVYTYMILYYQPHLMKFIHKAFGANRNHQVNEILFETKNIIQNYLVGLFIEFIILVVLNAVGLLLLGIEYAIILGLIGGALNVIPYLGGVITMVLFAIIALVTKTPEYVFYTICLYGLIQFIDNNYLVPKIVGSKVKLNALVSLMVVILGAALWGIPGMFLSIPFTAILKLILDRVEQLKPWGFLLGDTVSVPIKIDLGKILSKK